MSTTINFPAVIEKFDEIVKRGFCSGVGDPSGQMCVEAAICYALDLPHGDDPECVAPTVRSYKIRLNDATWSSPFTRSAGLRNLGIAQIGSRGVFTDEEFTKRLSEKTIRVLIPTMLRDLFPDNSKLAAAADACEKEGTVHAARAADAAAHATYAAAHAARAAADAAADAARAADAAADAATYATYAAAHAARAAAHATYAAAHAARAAADAAADAARAADAATYAARAADAATYAARAADAAFDPDKYLKLSASLALEVLRELASPGCEFLEVSQ